MDKNIGHILKFTITSLSHHHEHVVMCKNRASTGLVQLAQHSNGPVLAHGGPSLESMLIKVQIYMILANNFHNTHLYVLPNKIISQQTLINHWNFLLFTTAHKKEDINSIASCKGSPRPSVVHGRSWWILVRQT